MSPRKISKENRRTPADSEQTAATTTGSHSTARKTKTKSPRAATHAKAAIEDTFTSAPSSPVLGARQKIDEAHDWATPPRSFDAKKVEEKFTERMKGKDTSKKVPARALTLEEKNGLHKQLDVINKLKANNEKLIHHEVLRLLDMLYHAPEDAWNLLGRPYRGSALDSVPSAMNFIHGQNKDQKVSFRALAHNFGMGHCHNEWSMDLMKILRYLTHEG